MSFADPLVLYFLALVPLLIVIFVVSERHRRAHLTALVVSEKPGLVMGAGFERRLIFLVLLCVGVVFLVVAAARPQWGTKLEQVSSRGIDLILAVDVSESMRATDVSPNRMAKARQEVDKFLGLLEGDRVGLIAFAGSAYTYVPLTVDYGAVRLFLNSLEPGVIDDAGTDLGKAVEEAIETFSRSKSSAYKVLVVFSDGEHHETDPLPAVTKATEAGIQVFTIGIGNVSRAGERIPVPGEDDETTFKLDQQGNLVITRLDEQTLKAIAQEGNGEYYRVSEAGTELVEIYRSLAEKEETEFSSRTHYQKEDRFQIPLIVALVFLAVAYSLGNRTFKKLRRTQGVLL